MLMPLNKKNLKVSKLRTEGFKIAGYVRISTEEQAENPEGSIRNQQDRIRDVIDFRNRNGNYGELVHTFIDPGISAKDMKRPALQEMLRAIRSGEVNLVIVTELSRLSRNTRDFIQIWDLMREVGCRFASLREDFDTTNAAGELVLFQLMNLAQFERRQTSERVEANIAARSKRGLYNGGSIPIGYKRVEGKSGYLEIDDTTAPLVREAFATFLREGSLAAAAMSLNDRGYTLKKDSEGGGRLKRVGHFTVSNLQALLRNKIYVGVKCFRVKDIDLEAKAVWPAIIDEVTFSRAGKIPDRNRFRLKPHKANKLPYVLTGLTVCSKCGKPLVGKSATGNGGKVGYYEHGWATKRDSTLTKKMFKCEPHRVPSKKLEPLVWQKFLTLINDPKFIREILRRVLEFHNANPTRKDQERLKAKIFGLNSQIDALAERLSELPKGISAAPIYKQMQRLEDLKLQHQNEIEGFRDTEAGSIDRVTDLKNFEAFAASYRKLTFENLTADQKKQLLRRFIQKIEVDVESVKIHFIVDQEHYKQESALSSASSNRQTDFLKISGSNTLTVGTGRGT
ncbi:MAG: recombinase family protein [Proteobacteria bacterium]|nr:MAG: recombinase family protein [Pseudomonadota bacterium]